MGVLLEPPASPGPVGAAAPAPACWHRLGTALGPGPTRGVWMGGWSLERLLGGRPCPSHLCLFPHLLWPRPSPYTCLAPPTRPRPPSGLTLHSHPVSPSLPPSPLLSSPLSRIQQQLQLIRYLSGLEAISSSPCPVGNQPGWTISFIVATQILMQAINNSARAAPPLLLCLRHGPLLPLPSLPCPSSTLAKPLPPHHKADAQGRWGSPPAVPSPCLAWSTALTSALERLSLPDP